jgi:RNA polymerase sigma-70 factor (ECF subfamily)
LLQVVTARIGPGRVADAEDIVQESLTRAWQRLSQYDFQYRFSTWLFTIAVRISTDHLRRWQRAPAVRELDNVEQPVAASPDHLEQAESINNIWSTAAEVLNEAQYTAMWLRYGEDLAVYEVARILGRTRVGTRVLLHRARAILMPLLQDASEVSNSQQEAGQLPEASS